MIRFTRNPHRIVNLSRHTQKTMKRAISHFFSYLFVLLFRSLCPRWWWRTRKINKIHNHFFLCVWNKFRFIRTIFGLVSVVFLGDLRSFHLIYLFLLSTCMEFMLTSEQANNKGKSDDKYNVEKRWYDEEIWVKCGIHQHPISQ